MPIHINPASHASLQTRWSPRFSFSCAALHEIYAATEADAPGMTGAGLAFARLLTGARPVLWVRQEFLTREAGAPHAPGLVEFGLDPSHLTFVRVRDAQAALQAGLEGARFASLGAVMIELWGEAKALDLTASRRLALAAKASGTLVLLARIAAPPRASAAETRWRVRSAPSRALAANAPGGPAFSLSLLRHRGGFASGEWHLEWNRDQGCFEERVAAAAIANRPRSIAPLPVDMVSVSFDRPGGTGIGGASSFRKTG